MTALKTRWKRNAAEGLLCIFSACIYLAAASYFTSPLTGIYGSDSSFFQMVGQAMTKGMLPYRDFFDMKGPYLFLIQYLGQLICYGRLGCFIMQVINLSITLWFGCRCIRIVRRKASIWLELLLLVPCAIVLFATLDGGNLTEEYALSTLIVTLYLCLRTYQNRDGAPVSYGFIYGLLFAYNSLIRITNAGFICAVVFSVGVRLLCLKQYRTLFQNAAAFSAGFLTAFLPPVLFFASQGLAIEMFRNVFAFGMTYATENGFQQMLVRIGNILGWELILLSPSVVLLLTGSRSRDDWLLSISSFLFVSLILMLGNDYVHYYTLVIPSILYAICLLAKQQSDWSTLCRRGIIAGMVCFFLAAIWLQRSDFSKVKRSYHFLKQQAVEGYSWRSVSGVAEERQGIAAYIPENELDSVYAYQLPMDFFCQMDFFPCNKYCCWQDHYVQLDPSIEKELRAFFEQTPPKWFLVRSHYTVDSLPEYFGDLRNVYEEYETVGDIKLLRLKGDNNA